MMIILAFALLGYLSGSVPFGVVFTRMAGLGDVRQIGSGNIGATNVLRTGSKKIAALTLLADILKGTAPVLIAFFMAGELAGIAAALGAFLGHLFPVWLGFKGGKGVATFLGVLLGLHWPVALTFIAVWLIVAGIFRYSSLAALCAVLAASLAAIYFGSSATASGIAIMGAIVILRHRENIVRLLQGTETPISFGSRKS
jgi:acyl phosphate:glycerol-3-phosphate acyltransferase